MVGELIGGLRVEDMEACTQAFAGGFAIERDALEIERFRQTDRSVGR
jgi:hypothetical protein